MTQKTCGICGLAPSDHSEDQLHKCFSDAGFEVEHTVTHALFIGREFRLVRKYSPPDAKGVARIWFKSDPETIVNTNNLSDAIFKEALPHLQPQEKKDGGNSEEPEQPEDPEDMVFDDETLSRMDDASDDHTIDAELEPSDEPEG